MQRCIQIPQVNIHPPRMPHQTKINSAKYFVVRIIRIVKKKSRPDTSVRDEINPSLLLFTGLFMDSLNCFPQDYFVGSVVRLPGEWIVY